MKYTFLAIACLCGTAATATAEGTAPPPEAARCASCHGADGDSVSASVPRLNGQKADYILSRLRDFHDPASQSPHATYFMWNVTTSIGAKTVAALASYYAAQRPTPPKNGDGALAQAGRRLYQSGDGAHVPACQDCHGAGGTGEGEGLGPRLTGQHNIYLDKQMANFEMRTRYNKTMDFHSRYLTMEQRQALVAYLGGD